MKFLHSQSEISEMKQKRFIYLDVPEPSVPRAQMGAEEERIVDTIAGKERNGSVLTQVDTKIKRIADRLNAVQVKVSTLGTDVESKFGTFVNSKYEALRATVIRGNASLGNSLPQNVFDPNNPAASEVQIKRVFELASGELNLILREFDRGLDKVMLRVNFRKQMADKLEELGTGTNALTLPEKNSIGTALERQLALLEGNIEGNSVMTVDQLKSRMSVLHEITKYSNMLKECKATPAASSLANAKLIPEHAIAYPPTPQNGFTYFEYWMEEVGGKNVLHCIDNNGVIQQMDVQKPGAFGNNPWEVVYNPNTRPVTRNSTKLTNPQYTDAYIAGQKPNPNTLSSAQREQMLRNGMRERVFINAADRGFTGMPANQRSELEGLLAAEFSRLQTAQRAAYLANPGSSSSIQPMVDTFTNANSAPFKTSVDNVTNRVAIFTHGLTHNTTGNTVALTDQPASSTTRPTTGPSTAAERARETRLRPFNNATVSEDRIALGGISDQQINKDITLATLGTAAPSTVQVQIVDASGREINYLQIRDNKVMVDRTRAVTIPDGPIEFKLQSRDRTATSTTWIQSELYSVENESVVAAVDRIRSQQTTIERGQITANPNISIMDYRNQLPQGYELAGNIDQVMMQFGAFPPIPVPQQNFEIRENQIFYIGTAAIQPGTILTFTMGARDISGNVNPVQLELTIGNAEALDDDDVSFDKGIEKNGRSHLDIAKGPIASQSTEKPLEGLKINAPEHASLEITKVIKDKTDTNPGTELKGSDNKPILEIKNGQVVLKSGNALAKGVYFINIKSTVVDGANKKPNDKHWVSFEIKDAPTPAPTPAPAPSPSTHEMPKTTTDAGELWNIRMGNELRETWNNETSHTEMKDMLKGFEKGGSVSLFTLGTIDAKSGRYFVTNNNFSTLLTIEGSEIVLEGGAPGKKEKIRFKNDKTGQKRAITFAVALNKILDSTINDLELDEISRFDSDGKAGEFFEYDDGTVQANDDTGSSDLTDQDIWEMPESLRDQEEDFIKLANAVMKDYMGDADGDDKREIGDDDHEAPVGTNLNPNETKAIIGRKIDFTINNMDEKYIYTYSANRMDWKQIPKKSGTENISIPYTDFDNDRTGEIIKKNGKDYVRIIIMASPRNPQTNNNRPVVIEKDLEIIRAYETGWRGANTFSAISSVSSHPHIQYELKKGMKSTVSARPYTSDTMTVREEKDSEGRLVVLKNDEPFAKLSFEEDGSADVSFIKDGDDKIYKYEAKKNSGNEGTLEFTKFH